MNNQQSKQSLRDKERRMLPFAVEFVKFFTVFIIIVAFALLALHFTVAAMQ